MDAIEIGLVHAHKEGTVINVSANTPDDGIDDDLHQLFSKFENVEGKSENKTMSPNPHWTWNYYTSKTGKTIPIAWLSDFDIRQQAVKEVAKADPNNIQEVAASQLSIINSYYQSGLHQSQQSFKWSLIWGGRIDSLKSLLLTG